MDFTFTAEQTLLRDTLSRLLEQTYSFETRQAAVLSPRGWSAALWAQLRDLGLLALPLPADAGGLGGTIVDVAAVGELLGRHLIVEPFLPSVLLAGAVLARCERTADAARWLEQIAAGELLAALAHEEGRGTGDPVAIVTALRPRDGGWTLHGRKELVLGGDSADLLAVSAKLPDGRLALAAIAPDAPGIALQSYATIDGRRAAAIDFDDAAVTAVLSLDAASIIAGAFDDALIALAAEAVGAMGALLEETARHAATRQQFGVPIASFQAVAHRLADMKLAHVKARSLLLYTAGLAEAGLASSRDVSLLKAQVGRLGRALAESAIQLHGGVGTTDELVVGHLFKRVLAVDVMFGGADHHFRAAGAVSPIG